MDWIKIADRKPEPGQRVLLYGPEIGVASVVAHLSIYGEWVDRIPEYLPYLKHATHWMPLPDAPASS